MQIEFHRDEFLSERQLSRRQEFLRAATFLKPYDVIHSRTLLEKSGLGPTRAKLVVEISFYGSFVLFLGFSFGFLRLFKGITGTGVGFWFYLLLGLLFMYVVHYFMARQLVRYFKARQLARGLRRSPPQAKGEATAKSTSA